MKIATVSRGLFSLLDGGILDYRPGFVLPPAADQLFSHLRVHIPWRPEITAWGRSLPRLTAWFADAGLRYSYSGVFHVGNGWNKTLAEIKQQAEEAGQTPFNSLLLNYYRDGRDSLGWHTDAEPSLGENPVIASITLGATRDFKLRHKRGASFGKLTIPLTHGSLLIMGGTTQHHWLHAVEKTTHAGPRINLTFRQIIRPGGELS